MTKIVGFVVGVERYDQPDWDVNGSCKNAIAIVRLLLLLGAQAEDIHLFTNTMPGAEYDMLQEELKKLKQLGIENANPTLQNLDTCFGKLADGQPNGARLFWYWSGHGYSDNSGNRVLVCQDFIVGRFHRTINATSRLLRLRTEEYRCFSQQVFLADVCATHTNQPFTTDPPCPDKVNTRQLGVFATREGGYSTGTFTSVCLNVLEQAGRWLDPHELFRKLILALEAAQLEPYTIYAGDEQIDWELKPSERSPIAYPDVAPWLDFHSEERIVARQNEQFAFRRCIDDLAVQRHTSGELVFLLQGVGGMGKSTLLRHFSKYCHSKKDLIYWLYTDWELAGISSSAGTPSIMAYLVAQMRKKYQIAFPLFEAVYREKSRWDDPDERWQVKLSQSFISDIAATATIRPIILLFDTWETVSSFADGWVRGGLIRSLLQDERLSRRVLLVVAGRIVDEVRVAFKDDVIRAFGFRALFERDLDVLTPGDIREYGHLHGCELSIEDATRIWNYTGGIPLGVGLVVEQINSRNQNLAALEDMSPAGSLEIVTQQLSRRVLHWVSDETERKRIISLVTLRYGPDQDNGERLDLLKLMWEKCFLLKNSNEFDVELRRLLGRHSFIQSSGRIHPLALPHLQRSLMAGVHEAAAKKICGDAKKICELQLEIRSGQLSAANTNFGNLEQKQINDPYWRAWSLHKVHYQFWLNEIEDAVKAIVDLYSTALIFRVPQFGKQLLALCDVKSNPLSERLEVAHRETLRELQLLDSSLRDSAIEFERAKLKGSLGAKAQIAELLGKARFAARANHYESAQQCVIAAERLMKQNSPKFAEYESELGRTFLYVGERLAAASSRNKDLLVSKSFVENAQRKLPDNEYIECVLGDICVQLGWLQEASDHYRAAPPVCKSRVDAGLVRLRERRSLIGKDPVESLKLARVFTSQASGLCALARFDEAVRKVRQARLYVPGHVPAVIKLSHILRVMGDTEAALKELNSIEEKDVQSDEMRARLFDAYGACYLFSGRWDEAEQNYKQALKFGETYMNAEYGLGRVKLFRGDYLAAVDQFNRVISIKRNIVTKRRYKTASLYWVYIGRGLAHAAAARELDMEDAGRAFDAESDFLMAEKLCDRDIDERGDAPHYQLWSSKAIASLGLKEYEKAGLAIEKFIRDPLVFTAKGMHRQLRQEVELLRKVDSSAAFRRVITSLELLN